jgi:hypothetical protein
METFIVQGPKYIHKKLFQRFSEKNMTEDALSPVPWGSEEGQAERLSHFFKTAEFRKRQILEKMLMD